MMEIVSNVISDLWVNLSDTIFESFPNRPQQLNLLVAYTLHIHICWSYINLILVSNKEAYFRLAKSLIFPSLVYIRKI